MTGGALLSPPVWCPVILYNKIVKVQDTPKISGYFDITQDISMTYPVDKILLTGVSCG
jgi:hypothetical protein